MKTPVFKICLWGTLAVLLLVFAGWTAYSDEGGVVQVYKKATAPFDDEKKVASVLSLAEKTILVRTPDQGGPFWTETRKDKMGRYKCNDCHNNEKVVLSQAAEITHGDIILDHGGQENPLSCFTCHKENERDFLTSEKGVQIDMDHSYQICGRCHFRQKKDWVGGAHGKRISYWAGKRVVRNCASCHDPHSPLFEKRWPKTYSPPFKK